MVSIHHLSMLRVLTLRRHVGAIGRIIAAAESSTYLSEITAAMDLSYTTALMSVGHAAPELKPNHLTNRWSQPLAVVISCFDFMKPPLMFITLAAASGGSALSR